MRTRRFEQRPELIPQRDLVDHSSGPALVTQTYQLNGPWLQRLQRTAGNRAVAGLLGRRHPTYSSPLTVQRKTKGEEMVERSDKWLQVEVDTKRETDVLRAALREVKKGKSVAFNKTEGLKRVESAVTIIGLGATEKANLRRKWEWLIDERKSASTTAYKTAEKSFFGSFVSPMAKLGDTNPKSQAKYWLKNTAPQIVDVIYSAADAELPAVQLYSYAAKEGLVDYTRDQIGLGKKDEPTKAQLGTVSTTKPISGFDYLGLDDYGTELGAARHPLTGFLPTGFDQSKVNPIKRTNEKGREVSSGEFPNLTMALQALSAMLKRRRKLFQEDASVNGYAPPTEDELVYWTYVYFNAGEFGGNAQLKKYKGKRKLSDWINKGEFDNSIKLLQSYRTLRDMKVF